MLFWENRINGAVYSDVVSRFLYEDTAFRTLISMCDIKIPFKNKSSIDSA